MAFDTSPKLEILVKALFVLLVLMTPQVQLVLVGTSSRAGSPGALAVVWYQWGYMEKVSMQTLLSLLLCKEMASHCLYYLGSILNLKKTW